MAVNKLIACLRDHLFLEVERQQPSLPPHITHISTSTAPRVESEGGDGFAELRPHYRQRVEDTVAVLVEGLYFEAVL